MPTTPARTILERELVRAVLTLARSVFDKARTPASQARLTGVYILTQRAERLLQYKAPPPLMQLPRLVWM